MSLHRDHRFLAERVELDFHRQPNHTYRRIWLWSAGLALVVFALALLPMIRGTYANYAAGPVSHAHHMIENDCARCHLNWTLWDRLTSVSTPVLTVDNKQCLSCHDGGQHHARQIPAHADLSCAECHREHRGQQQLAQIGDSQCVRCHENLNSHGGSERFALEITSFDREGRGRHPEFALDRLLGRVATTNNLAGEPDLNDLRKVWKDNSAGGDSSGNAVSAGGSNHKDRAQKPTTPTVDDRGLRAGKDRIPVDRGRIHFNHAIHLKAEYKDGVLIQGLRDQNRQLVDWSQECQKCHEPDASGRYMRPINYKQHCAQCHPLYFDNSNFPGETVPHEMPTTVRGFLVELYSRKLMASSTEPSKSVDDPFSEEADGVKPSRLPTDKVRAVREKVARVIDDRFPPLDPMIPEFVAARLKSKGGCQYCHTVNQSANDPLWPIEKPQIPERWFQHAEFDHAAHRMVECGDCHQVWKGNEGSAPVQQSNLTEDVLIPGITVCRDCHSAKPDVVRLMPNAQIHGAGTHCVECHKYHAPSDPLVNRLSDGTDATPPAAWKPQDHLHRSPTGKSP
ncbi:MAG: hypothetical protein NT069_13890 [Planctomycetota bacterium]|nr:hypothetical protein [Planctomycetota bacterium]